MCFFPVDMRTFFPKITEPHIFQAKRELKDPENAVIGAFAGDHK